jgi:PAB-dependent poly(A)-specific ribonuclease subunit 2
LKPGKDKHKTRLDAMPTEVLEPWLPEVFGVQLDKKSCGVKVVEGTDVGAVQDAMGPADSPTTCAVYELVALISHIQEGDMDEAEEKGMNPTELKKKRQERDEGHLVTHIRPHCVYYDHGTIQTPSKATPGISPLPLGKFVRRSLDRRANLSTKPQPASPPPLSAASNTEPRTPPTPANAGISSASKPEQWFLFNDFCVVPSDAREARQMYGKHKVPCLLFYHRIDLPMPKPLPHSNISNELFRKLTPDPLALNLPNPTFKPLNFHSEVPYHGQLLAIDAEFVSYAPAEKEVLEDGSELEVRPAQLGLARVSVVRGDSGPSHGACCMDDYVRTVEPVYDYLTRYSGLVHGDLDPAVSKHHITTLKHAYLKLRYLADSGCKFVGHGLKKDFRMANIVIPIENVVDTVEIFHFKRQRKLSLRFLSSYLLGLDIQQGTHDSIEDATVALALYKKYLELENAGTFQETLLAIYTYGKQFGWDLVKPKVAVPVQQ